MASRVSSPIFVGRRRELETAAAALDRARQGQAAVVLVAGEAGVGKTRFVSEVANRARQSGFRVLAGGCVQMGGEGLPFAAVIEALRGLAHELSPAELDRLVGFGRSELARLMPDLAVESDRAPAPGSFDNSAQGRLFEHLLRLLVRLADRAQLLVVIEDIHWADRSTLELLDFLARNLRQGSIALLATYRSDELHRRHPLLPFLAELERLGRAERLELTRFGRAELASQLAGILGTRAVPEVLELILARSEGNAFYAEELLAAGARNAGLPDTLRDVLLARVATLSEPTQELIRTASAAGQRVAPELLASVAGTQEQALTAALREAVARQILVPWDGPGDEHYAFRHALVQEAVYDDLLPGERPRLHAAFARALNAEPRPDDASRAAELAYHWQAAHDLPHAFDAWIAAGIAAEGISAFAEAAADFGRALDLWDQVPDAEERAPIDRIELLSRAAAAAETVTPSRSIAYLRQAIDLVDPTTDPTRAGLLFEQLGECTTSVRDNPNALAAYREGVRLVPTDPPSAARARVLVGLARALSNGHRHHESMALAEEALRTARAVGAPREESRALIPLAINQVKLGAVETGIANYRRAHEIATAVGDVYTAARALASLSGLLWVAGQYDATVTVGFEGHAYATSHGLGSRFGSTSLSHVADGLIALGRWDEAAVALEQAQGIGGVQDNEVEPGLVLVDALQGRFEAAARRTDRGDPSVGWFYPGTAELALWQGDPLTARNDIRERVAIFDAQPEPHVVDVGWSSALGLRAEADLAGFARATRSESQLHEARKIGTTLLARMRSLEMGVAARRPYYTPQAEAWQATCEAEFSRLEGEQHPDRWAAAAAAWNALGLPYFKAYALMREGEAALAGPRDRRGALDALTAARAIAVRLGAAPLRQMIDEIAARAVGRPEPTLERAPQPGGRSKTEPRTAIPRDRDRLTPRERDVLALVAAGRSDGDIAQALFITKKTASSHVAHIKAKLGAQSRVEIATQAIGLGLVAAPRSGGT